jgi:hypothetical protein
MPGTKMTNEEEAAAAIAQSINCMSHDLKEVGERLANIHPTLQQSFMGVALAFIKALAAKEYVDLRNEASQKLARRLLEGVEESDTYLPFV